MQDQSKKSGPEAGLLSRLPKPSMRQRRLAAMSSAAAIVLIGLGAFALLPPVRAIQTAGEPTMVAANETEPTGRAPRMLENSAPFSFADLVERVSPAVVTITSETTTTDSDMDADNIPAPFRDLFNQFNNGQKPQPHRALSAGSGFIIDKSGYVVTNNHVVDASKKITVKLPDGRSFTAKLIGTDPATDIALLKINSDKDLPKVEFGDDKKLRVGDWVVAVGNPFGLSNSVTAGIVSSLGRNIESSQQYTNFIQIDAPINRGNSGGPSFDLDGNVVGVNTAIFSPSGGSVGIGFAIPATTVKTVIRQLREKGVVTRGALGIEIQPITPRIASALGLKRLGGALVNEAEPDGSAAKAGIVPGDVITTVDGQPIPNDADLANRIGAMAPGTAVKIGILRNGSERTVSVTLGELPVTPFKTATAPPNENRAGLGLGLAPAATVEGAGSRGVVITEVDPNGLAAEEGLAAGNIILDVSGNPVRTSADVHNAVGRARESGKHDVLMRVKTRNWIQFVALPIAAQRQPTLWSRIRSWIHSV